MDEKAHSGGELSHCGSLESEIDPLDRCAWQFLAHAFKFC